MSEWQPIETAPRGEVVIFWLDWSKDCAALNPPLKDGPGRLHIGVAGGWSSVYRATHWMPLPTPPSTVVPGVGK